MKLFGKKAGRAEARPALSRSGFSAIGDWPPSYEAQVREGYCRNAIAQRAVRLVAEAVAGAPLVASDPALAALVGARAGGVPVLEVVATQLQLHGNAFVQVLRDAEGEAAGLYPLRPERVTVEADATGWPAAYLYRVGARAARLHGEAVRPEVVHLKLCHPLDDHYGLGSLGAAAAAIAVHNQASAWNKALLDNAARPSGALVYDPGDGSTLSSEQFQRLSSEMEQGFSGATQAGRPMLLEGGLKWQALSLGAAAGAARRAGDMGRGGRGAGVRRCAVPAGARPARRGDAGLFDRDHGGGGRGRAAAGELGGGAHEL